jgi:diguanylate cyclase
VSRGRGLLWIALGLVAALFAGKALLPGDSLYSEVLTARHLLWIGSLTKLFFAAVAVTAAVAVVRGFEADNPARRAWVLLTLGLGGFLAGQSILGYFQLVLGLPIVFPSPADFFFVFGSLSLAVALVTFVRAYAASGLPVGEPRERWTLALGAAVLCAAIVTPILRPIVQTPAPPLEKLLNLAYPILDVLLLIPMLLLLRMSFRFWGGRLWVVWGALAAGVLFTAAGDILFAYRSGLGLTHLEDLFDAMYILSFGCLAGGVLAQRDLLRMAS